MLHFNTRSGIKKKSISKKTKKQMIVSLCQQTQETQAQVYLPLNTLNTCQCRLFKPPACHSLHGHTLSVSQLRNSLHFPAFWTLPLRT